jgi:archaellum biogenesis ATPase FlaH
MDNRIMLDTSKSIYDTSYTDDMPEPPDWSDLPNPEPPEYIDDNVIQFPYHDRVTQLETAIKSTPTSSSSDDMVDSGKTINQQNYMEHPVAANATNDFNVNDDVADFSDKPPVPKFSLNQFSVNGKSEVMRKKMHDDVFVLYGIAILGQLTVIYAKPNTGKTLITLAMLVDSIKAGRIKGENVYYINADDAYKGSIQKLELAEKYGFQMILPNSKESAIEFKATEFNGHLRQLINDEAAHGVIIVLDTLKKFTDLMDKKKGSEFMELAREFSLAGGTMIMLAHTNKNRSADGKLIAGGTSDITDDCDCAYTLDEVEGIYALDEMEGNGEPRKDVLFENFKSRGNVKKELLASYSIDENISDYFDLFNSVQIANSGDTEQAKKERDAATKASEDKAAINAIIDAIEQGNCKRLEIVAYVMKAWGVSRRKANDTLDAYTGTKKSNSSFWRVDNSSTAKIYLLLKPENVSPDDYEKAKNG